MPNESLNLPKEIDSNIIKEVLKQIGGADELITSVPDNTKLNIEQLADIENKLSEEQKLRLNNMISDEGLASVSGGEVNMSPKTKNVLKKVGEGALCLGGSALLLAVTVFLGKKGIAAWERKNKRITAADMSQNCATPNCVPYASQQGYPTSSNGTNDSSHDFSSLENL